MANKESHINFIESGIGTEASKKRLEEKIPDEGIPPSVVKSMVMETSFLSTTRETTHPLTSKV